MPVAVITGASVGLGRDFARLAARDGYDVVLVARNRGQLEALAAATGRPATVMVNDLARPGASAELWKQIEAADLVPELLVNNAGFGLLGRFWDLDLHEQSRMIQLNVTALTDLTRLCLPGMIARRQGYVLNVASTAAFQPGPLMAVYYATKAFVVSFSHAIHNEAKPYGVKVTCLCPGPTKTEFAERARMNATKLFSSGLAMSSEEVAAIGMRAVKRGRPLVIAGRMNALGAFLTRFAPRHWAAAMARRVQES